MTQCSESAASRTFWPARRAFAESGPPTFRHGTGAASRGNATMFGGGELVDKASLLQSQHYKEALKDRRVACQGPSASTAGAASGSGSGGSTSLPSLSYSGSGGRSASCLRRASFSCAATAFRSSCLLYSLHAHHTTRGEEILPAPEAPQRSGWWSRTPSSVSLRAAAAPPCPLRSAAKHARAAAFSAGSLQGRTQQI